MRRANEVSDAEWRPIPAGVWRFRINPQIEVKFYEQWNGYRARFPLLLVTDEQTRLLEEYGKPAEGTQQSTRATPYMTGLSLGYPDKKTGAYKSTKLTDFLAACLGQTNQKKFFDWIAAGGGPKKPQDPDNPDEELQMITQWLGWFEDLEVLGSVRHEEDAQGNVWARFGGPMAVGSLPKQPEVEYQALGLGKLRSMVAEFEQSAGIVRQRLTPINRTSSSATTTVATAPSNTATRTAPHTYEEIFGDDNAPHTVADQNDIPF